MRIGLEVHLFEEGVITSLRVLDLIAFVEELTGTRIPDSEVRLANFRSVRAIAAAFGEESRQGPRSVALGGETIRVFAQPTDSDLRRKGRAREMSERISEFFDTVALEWAMTAGAQQEAVSTRLPREVLTRAGCPIGRPAPGESVVPPAVCYHVYNDRQGTRLSSAPLLVTVRARCHRDEESPDPAAGRLIDFEMREIVALGSREEVEQFREAMIDRVSTLMIDLGLEGRIVTADDPFFLQNGGEEARGRWMMQQILPLKYELRLPLGERGLTCAVASFNHHLDFFGRRFCIRLPSGSATHTGCVAFGLERWALAFLAQHGTDEAGWPTPVREFCSREVEA
jgi:acyl carrier protein